MAEVTIEGEQVVFPHICPVCQMPATVLYPYKKDEILQRVAFPIAYCDQHSSQLIRSDEKLTWIKMIIYGMVVIVWGLAAYELILRFPEFKIVPGDTLVTWGITIILTMCAIGFMAAVVTSGIGLRFAVQAIPVIVQYLFETRNARTTRRAIAVKNFKLRSNSFTGGPAQLQSVIFSINDPKYAQELHKLNPGSRLAT